MLNDPLAAILTKIVNAEKVGKKSVTIAPASKLIKKVLEILNNYQYIGSFEEVETGQGTELIVNLLGNINKCGAIKPRFSTKFTEFEKWITRYLPAREMGIILISTSNGLMTHKGAMDKKIGGKLIAYCY